MKVTERSSCPSRHQLDFAGVWIIRRSGCLQPAAAICWPCDTRVGRIVDCQLMAADRPFSPFMSN